MSDLRHVPGLVQGYPFTYRLEGDHPRDETQELHRAGLRIVLRKELSKLGTVHLVVAEKLPPA